jgi:hypothetical protein
MDEECHHSDEDDAAEEFCNQKLPPEEDEYHQAEFDDKVR